MLFTPSSTQSRLAASSSLHDSRVARALSRANSLIGVFLQLHCHHFDSCFYASTMIDATLVVSPCQLAKAGFKPDDLTKHKAK